MEGHENNTRAENRRKFEQNSRDVRGGSQFEYHDMFIKNLPVF